MITDRKILDFYIAADRMMNRGIFRYTLPQRLFRMFNRDYIMEYLESLRRLEYWQYRLTCRKTLWGILMEARHRLKVKNIGQRLGFSMAPGVLGYGVVIPHWGTIIVGCPNRIGPYCVLQACTCISGNGKAVGKGLYMGVGAKLIGKVELGDNVSVGANAVVVASCPEGGALLTGVPAGKKADAGPWWANEEYGKRHEAVEALRISMSLE